MAITKVPAELSATAITITTAAQPNITSVGTLTSLGLSGNVTLGDNNKAIFGTSNDLQIYHNGSASFITDVGTGDLFVRASNSLKLQSADGENYLVANANGAVTLYYNNSAKFQTTSTGIDVTGSITADGILKDTASSFNYISGGNASNAGANILLYGQSHASLANTTVFRASGSEVMRLTSTGIDVTGTISSGAITSSGQLELQASTPSIHFLDTDDNSDGYIQANAGTLRFYADDANEVGGSIITFNIDGSEKLRIDNAGNVGIGASGTLSSKTVINVSGAGTQSALLLNNAYGYGSGVGVASAALQFARDNTPSNGQAIISAQIHSGNENESTSNPSNLIFSTKSGTSPYNLTEAMRIDSSGNVGIGTDSPEEKLHVLGQAVFENIGNTNRGNIIMGAHGSGVDKWASLAATHYNEATSSGNGSGNAGVMIIGSFSNSSNNRVYIGHGPYELNPATEIYLGTHNATTHNLGGSTRMFISSEGDVGINTTQPVSGSKLDVVDTDDMTMRVRSTGASSSGIRFQNSNTGTTSGDGLFVGVDAAGNAYHYNYENTASIFASNNTEVFRLRSDGIGLEFPDNNTFISTASSAGGTSYEWGSIRRPASSDGGQLSIRQYSSGDTAANYPAYAGGRSGWDENTGMYFPDTDQVGLTAGGNSGLVCYASTDARGIEVQDCLSTRANTTSTRAREHFYHFLSQATFSYAHMKTNIPWATSTQMYSIKFRGHEYGAAEPIDVSLVWYNYNPSNSAVNIGSAGTHTATVYGSSDGYTVMRITFTSGYYTAFTVSQYPTAQGCAMFNITASAANSTATHY